MIDDTNPASRVAARAVRAAGRRYLDAFRGPATPDWELIRARADLLNCFVDHGLSAAVVDGYLIFYRFQSVLRDGWLVHDGAVHVLPPRDHLDVAQVLGTDGL